MGKNQDLPLNGPAGALPSWLLSCPASPAKRIKEVREWPAFLMDTVYQSISAAAAKSRQSSLTLCDPMDCRPPGSSVHGILQARILEWGAISSSRGSSRIRVRTHISCVSWIGRQLLYCQCQLGSLSSAFFWPDFDTDPACCLHLEFLAVFFLLSVDLSRLNSLDERYLSQPLHAPLAGARRNMEEFWEAEGRKWS